MQVQATDPSKYYVAEGRGAVALVVNRKSSLRAVQVLDWNSKNQGSRLGGGHHRSRHCSQGSQASRRWQGNAVTQSGRSQLVTGMCTVWKFLVKDSRLHRRAWLPDGGSVPRISDAPEHISLGPGGF